MTDSQPAICKFLPIKLNTFCLLADFVFRRSLFDSIESTHRTGPVPSYTSVCFDTAICKLSSDWPIKLETFCLLADFVFRRSLFDSIESCDSTHRTGPVTPYTSVCFDGFTDGNM